MLPNINLNEESKSVLAVENETTKQAVLMCQLNLQCMQADQTFCTLRLLHYVLRSLNPAMQVYWNECDLIIRIVPDHPLGIQLTFRVQVLASSQRK